MKLVLMDALEKSAVRAVSQVEPVWLGMLAAYLEQHLVAEGLTVEIAGSREELLAAKPDVVGLSATTSQVNAARQIASEVKKHCSSLVILGGVHITALPLSLPPEIDIGVVGEGEATLLELIRLLVKEHELTPAVLKRVPGLVYHDGDTVHLTVPRPLFSFLDQLPYPKSLPEWSCSTTGYIYSSRGCPFRCPFCSTNVHLHLGRYRRFSPTYVIRWLQHLISEQKRTQIHWLDAVSFLSKAQVQEMAHLIQDAGLAQRAEFLISARADLIDDEVCHWLRSMNVTGISMGLESGSERMLSYLKGGTITLADNQRAIDACHRHGLKVFASFVIGFPQETEEDLRQSYAFIARNLDKLAGVGVTALVPYPGTREWHYAVRKGLIRSPVDWDRFDLFRGQCSLEEYAKRYIFLNETMDQESFFAYYRRFLELEQSIS